MPGSKTANPALPFALAIYIATSALRTTSSAESVAVASAGDADAGAHAHAAIVDGVGHPQLARQSFGHGEGALEVGRVVGQDRELVAAEPRHEVVRPHRGGDPLGHRLQQGVARRVAERVVDHLEVVEVHEQDRADRLLGIGQRGDDPLETHLEHPPVGGTRQGITLRKVLDVAQQHGVSQVQCGDRAGLSKDRHDAAVHAPDLP